MSGAPLLILRSSIRDTLTGDTVTITHSLTHRRYRIVSRCVWLDEPFSRCVSSQYMRIINFFSRRLFARPCRHVCVCPCVCLTGSCRATKRIAIFFSSIC